MNWKGTAVLAGVLAALLAAFFLVRPPGAAVDPKQKPQLLDPAEYNDQSLVRVDVARKGEAPYSLERGLDAVGPHWRLKGAGLDWPADTDLVQPLIWGMARLVRSGAIPAGRPEVAPSITGLDDPRVVVTFSISQAKKVFRFGKNPPTNSAAVFFQVGDDPAVYLADVDTFGAYDRAPAALRMKKLLRLSSPAVSKFTLEAKFVVARGREKREVEIEKSVFERLDRPDARGWHLVEPRAEKVDDHKVGSLLADLAALPVEEFRAPGDPAAEGFASPEARVAMRIGASAEPVVVSFGATADGNRKRLVRVEGVGEVALLDSARVENLALQRNLLRLDLVFPFPKEAMKTLRLEGPAAGRLLVERRESRKDEQSPLEVGWAVAEPRELKVDAAKIEPFVDHVLRGRIKRFLPPQDRSLLKAMRLDPPDFTIAVETRDGKLHLTDWGLTENEAYCRKEGTDELFEIAQPFVKALSFGELNVRHLEMFNVLRADVEEFAFSSKSDARLQPVFYRLRLERGTGKWGFVAPQGVVPDPDKVSHLLALVNYVKAQAFVGRDSATAEKYRLNANDAPATLEVVHKGGRTELYVSENQSERPGHAVYYAKLKDDPVVFQLSPAFVDALRLAPVRKP
jgi:hypothetical protein